MKTNVPQQSEPDSAPNAASTEDAGIGEQVRDLRKARGLTITDLADRIGRSIGYVSQVERNISSVSIPTLQKIAGALGVQVSWFFGGGREVPEGERDFIVRRDNRRSLTFGDTGVFEELLSPNLSGALELILTTFKPGSWTGEEDRIRQGEEAGYVVEGTLELWVEGQHFLLMQGDAFAFRRSGPHRCHNPGTSDTRVLWIMTPPSY
jgi:transcriptional regulator with XRE-family HTH domain